MEEALNLKNKLIYLLNNPDEIPIYFGDGSFADDWDLYNDGNIDETILDELNSNLYDIDAIEDKEEYKKKAIKIIEDILSKLKDAK